MKKLLNGLNVRKGLELEVPIEDIFKINTSPEGEEEALNIYRNSKGKKVNVTAEQKELIKNTDGEIIMYETESKKHIINPNLDAYVRDVFFAGIEESENGIPTYYSDIVTEVEFLNKKELTKHDFLINVMDAQSFIGTIGKQEWKHRFIGIGTFSLEKYLESHETLTYTDLHFSGFYLYHKNILSTISNFLFANYKKDAEEQKEYIKNEELYEEILKTIENQKKAIKEEFLKFDLFKGIDEGLI